MGQEDLISILILALFAGFIAFQFWRVLGRRTGNERARPNPYAARENVEGAVKSRNHDARPLPEARAGGERAIEDEIARIAPAGSPLAQALTEIQLADRTFDPEGFLDGARGAYEMIVMAFSEGDRATLKPLLAEDVFEGFAGAIEAREREGHSVDTAFVGLNDVKIVDAAMENRVAEITVRFVSEIIRTVRNADGAVIEGDPNTIQRITDVWTFARDTRSADPNWQLVATQSE